MGMNNVGLQEHHQVRSNKSHNVTAGARVVLKRIWCYLRWHVWRYDAVIVRSRLCHFNVYVCNWI